MNPADHPVPRPVLTACLLEKIVSEARAKGRKPHAFDTRLRYSSSGGCTRRLAYEALSVPETNPMDVPSLWVTFLGTIIHEFAQQAIAEKYGEAAQFEVTSITVECDSSGSADAVVILTVTPGPGQAKVLWELKTVNGTAFKTGVGVSSKPYGPAKGGPKGPRWTARLQAAINAVAHDCDLVVIGYLAMEAISKGLAERCGFNDTDRVCAEWVYPREVFETWAQAEILRQAQVLATVDAGELPDRYIIDDSGEEKHLRPEDSRRYWACDYCSHLDRCLEDGPGMVPVPVEIKGALA